MDANLVQQIYPVLAYAEKHVPDLKYEDKEALTADLYLAMVDYYNKVIPKFMRRLQGLENLKIDKNHKLKDQQFLDNIQKQQDGIFAESREKQIDLLTKIYNEWLEKLNAVL